MRLFSSTKIDNHLFDQIETQLLMADVGFETTKKILDSLITYVDHNKIKNTDALYSKLRADMTAILSLVNKPLVIENKKPFIILMVGVNGAGKTTTIGKIAHQYQVEKKSVMLAAGDTFRAAAVEQLQAWGELNNIPVVAQHTGADSASVIFDSIQSAKARGIDVLIADTSGRLQNNVSLMEELKKIVRVMKKIDIEAPHEVMLTIDAGTGQNAVQQALLFNKTIKITGITLTKLDGTAKGGIAKQCYPTPQFTVYLDNILDEDAAMKLIDMLKQEPYVDQVATTKAQRRLFFNLRKIKQRLGWFNQEEVEMVAKELGVTSKDVREMESRMAAQDIAFDPIPNDEVPDKLLMAPILYLQDKGSDFADRIEEQNWEYHAADKLNIALDKLDERSKNIIAARWLDNKKSTLQDLANKYGVSAERIRQLEKNAMKKIRMAIEAQ
ncbi:hypothetical protein J6590_046956 [Homalodisca vitripennis]|nr:hypothetical protein J6590_046956 [Homalodisca vitripennis]